jgi:hypothetical protein
MKNTVYCLYKKKGTEEYHLFEATPKNDNDCILDKQSSICNKMSYSETDTNVFLCAPENEARLKCAELGKKVCGTCVSHLYLTTK